MNLDEAGRLQDAWKTKHGDKLCHHTRIVDSLIAQDGQNTGNLVCRECGAIFPTLRNPLPDSSPPH